MPPKFIARNTDRMSGVLPVNAATRANSSKTSAARLKLEIRRLPPGLTLTEFEEALGDEWKLGNGRVDWREFRQGKVRASGSGKVPEQSRCCLHVVNETCVKDFEKRFLEVVFHDKAGTHRNPDLKNLQPTLGFAPNQRTPMQQAKPRTDTRQGTIDQDPEFIAFLESETQPIAKPPALDTISLEKDGERKEVKTTPLIEDLREKKANKAKAAQAKADKAEKDKKPQAVKGSKKDAPAAEKDASKGSQQQRVEQAAKDAAKALNKQAVSKQQQSQQQKGAAPAKSKKPPPSPKTPTAISTQAQSEAASSSPSPAPQRVPPSQRQRGHTEGIKKMLQKDLGIKPKSTPPAPPSATATTSTSTPSSPPPQSPAALAGNIAPTSNATSSPTQPASEAKPLPVKAYLKHANPSQGMTEILIQQALASYGEVANVTIDPRKGTAIAVFKQNEGLKKALEAKRIPVANGAVEVLEFRDRPSSGSANRGGGFRGGRGGRGGNRGGGQGGVSAVGSASPAAAAPSGP